MSTLTANMGLFKGVDVDDAENYLHVSLAASLDKIDGHQHGGGADGLAVTSLAAGTLGAGLLDIGGTVRASAQTPPASGTGVELAYSLGVGYLTAYSRGGAGVQPLVLNTFLKIFPSGGASLAAVQLDPGAYALHVDGAFAANNNFIVQPSGGVYVGNSFLDPGVNNLHVQGSLGVGSAFIVQPSGGVFVGNSFADPGVNNVQLQGWLKAGIGAVSAVTGNELIVANANQVGVHLYNEGTVTEWLMRQPAAATGHWLDLAKLVSSTLTPVLRLYSSTGVYVGQTPIDPGANNLTVQGTVASANFSTPGTVVGGSLADFAGTVRSTGQSTLSTGVGLEMVYDTGTSKGVVSAYDRAGAVYKDLVLGAFTRFYGSGGVFIGQTPSDPGVNNLHVQSSLGVGTAFIVQPSGGVYVGNSFVDPGVNNFQVQGDILTATQHLTGGLFPAVGTGGRQTATAIWAGARAPVVGDGGNGDIWFNGNGGSLTTIYQKRAGAWVGLV